MNNVTDQMNEKTVFLKEARLQLLRLHKMLVDIERGKFESANGTISSGQFLNVLLNDQNLQWLRKFSTLIVEIDEMLDLDDGFGEEMIEKHLSEMRKIINTETPDEEFNKKFREYLQDNTDIQSKNDELKNLLG